MNELTTTEDKNARLSTLAHEINYIKKRAEQAVIMAAIEIGERLLEIKATVPAGSWGAWLAENIDFSERKAQDMMRLYQEYGQGQAKLFGSTIDDTKLRSLSYTQAVALLSIKDSDERADFINSQPVEEMSTRELEAAIKAKNKAEKEAEEAKHKLAVSETRINDLEGAIADSKAVSEQKINMLQTAKKNLEERLTAATADMANNEAIRKDLNDTKTELKETQQKLFEAEEKLNAPIESTVVYETPKEITEELERLRAEVAKPQATADEDKVKFLLYAQELSALTQKILILVTGITDEEKQDKYKAKLRAMLATINQKL